MKVLMLNGSCNPKGCTYTALTEVGKTLTSAGIDYEIVQLGGDPVRDCIGCNQCSKNGCVFTDGGVNDFIAKARQADGFVFGTPVYYAHPSGAGAVLPGPGILRRRQRLCRKARRCGGLRPAGRHHRQSGRSGQVLRHLRHGDGGLHLLEHGPRPLSRGCDAGR